MLSFVRFTLNYVQHCQIRTLESHFNIELKCSPKPYFKLFKVFSDWAKVGLLESLSGYSRRTFVLTRLQLNFNYFTNSVKRHQQKLFSFKSSTLHNIRPFSYPDDHFPSNKKTFCNCIRRKAS